LKKMKHERFEKNNSFFTPGFLIFNTVSYFLFKIELKLWNQWFPLGKV